MPSSNAGGCPPRGGRLCSSCPLLLGAALGGRAALCRAALVALVGTAGATAARAQDTSSATPADSVRRAATVARDSSRHIAALQAVTVTATRSRTATVGYQARRSRSATRTDTRLRDVPQSVAVVTSQLIRDQGMRGLADVTRYVPGVTMGQGEGNRDQPTIRGIGSTSDFFLDGLRDDVEYFRDLYNVDRVEVLEGPNAMAFGRGGGGGVINRVSKEATFAPVRALSLEGGAFDQRRATVDVGQPLPTARLATRLNGMYEHSASYREYVDVERYGVNPTVTLAPTAGGSVRLGYELFDDHRTADRGVPSFRGRPLDADVGTFFGDPHASYADARIHAGTAIVEQQFGARLTLRNATRLAGHEKFYQNVFPGAVDAAGERVAIQGYNNRMRRTNLLNQTDVTYALRTGAVKHLLLGGAELSRQATSAFRNTGYFGDTTAMFTPVASPTVIDAPVTFRQSATDADANTVATVAAGYVQDQIELARYVQTIAGVRFDDFRLAYHNNRTGADLARRDRLVSPRLGVVVKPADAVSLYGSWSVSHLPASGNQFSSLTVTTRTLEPERFTNVEAGVKWDALQALSLTSAVYRLDRTNTSAPDPADPTHVVQTGAQRSRGAELGASGSVNAHWQLVAGYGYQDVRVTSATTAAKAGATVPLTPRHTASLWNRVQVTPAIGAGLGVVGQSRMYAAIDDRVTLPSFTRLDAAVYWTVLPTIRVQANVENLLGRRYYLSASGNNNITPGSPRTVRASLSAGF